MSEYVVSWPDKAGCRRSFRTGRLPRPFWSGLSPADREAAQEWEARAAQIDAMEFDPLG